MKTIVTRPEQNAEYLSVRIDYLFTDRSNVLYKNPKGNLMRQLLFDKSVALGSLYNKVVLLGRSHN